MQHKAPAPPPPTSGPRYVAIYDYTAADDDEVSFMEGQQYTVRGPMGADFLFRGFTSLYILATDYFSIFISLSVCAGDVMIEVQVIDDGWMEARVQRTGQFGMLPSNYVEKQ